MGKSSFPRQRGLSCPVSQELEQTSSAASTPHTPTMTDIANAIEFP
jgi:hypothetical protein